MKKLILIFWSLFIFNLSNAQLNAEFTWCPVPDSSGQLCCIQFENLSTDTGGIITSYFYIFGDGQESTLMEPRHCYVAIGTYEVYLFVTDNMGNTDTAIHNLTITHLDTVGCNCDSLIGINENDFNNNLFSLSPNPFRENSTLTWKIKGNSSGNLSPAEIRIYNSTGTIVRVEDVHLNKSQFILERKDLPAGIYNFEILSGDKTRMGTGKFIIE